MAGYDPEELNYVRMEEYMLAGRQNLQCREFLKEKIMLGDVWTLGSCQVQDPAEQGLKKTPQLKKSSSVLCIPGP